MVRKIDLFQNQRQIRGLTKNKTNEFFLLLECVKFTAPFCSLLMLFSHTDSTTEVMVDVTFPVKLQLQESTYSDDGSDLFFITSCCFHSDEDLDFLCDNVPPRFTNNDSFRQISVFLRSGNRAQIWTFSFLLFFLPKGITC